MKHLLWLLAGILSLLSLPSAFCADKPIIIDHNHMDVTAIPQIWLDGAKSKLHIAYGHTSHGSQVTSGMSGLVGFTGGVGGPQYAWNNGGSGGALDLHDYAMAGDCGYYPQWVNNTRAYLDNPANSDVNVIIWSWCGQVSGYTEQQMIDRYLAPMTQLELDYPDVYFVYMTGHLNYWSRVNTNARNQQIRDYCLANNKILYDFADIESYNPDGTYFPYANDSCDYWDAGGTLQGNWATEWQNSHTQGVDWYSCSSAHSQPLNANQKAYAAWWLWAEIAKESSTSVNLISFEALGHKNKTELKWKTGSEQNNAGFFVWRSPHIDGPYVKINTKMILAKGGPTQGAEYSFLDPDAIPYKTCFYKLEDVECSGVNRFHGPIHTLWMDAFKANQPFIPSNGACQIQLELSAGVYNGLRNYLVFASLHKGELHISHGITLPLAWDSFTLMTLNQANTPLFTDFMGQVDPMGNGCAQLNILSPIGPKFIGAKLHFAYGLGQPWDFGSNPVTLIVVP